MIPYSISVDSFFFRLFFRKKFSLSSKKIFFGCWLYDENANELEDLVYGEYDANKVR